MTPIIVIADDQRGAEDGAQAEREDRLAHREAIVVLRIGRQQRAALGGDPLDDPAGDLEARLVDRALIHPAGHLERAAARRPREA